MYDIVFINFTDNTRDTIYVHEDDDVQDAVVIHLENNGWTINEIVNFEIVAQVWEVS